MSRDVSVTARRCRRLLALVVVLVTVGAVSLLDAPPSAALGGQYWVSKLQLSKVWKITKGAGVTVGVIDSGVPPAPALRGRLLRGTDVQTGGSGQTDPGDANRSSHGQDMALDIAGDGAGGNTIGIAPAARILPVKTSVSTSAEISSSAAASGIRYAVAHGAMVLNLSFAAPGECDPAEGAAIKYAYQHDVIVVAGAGNDGSSDPNAPADCPGAIAVSGVDKLARPWSGSNYGSYVDLTNFATDIPSKNLDGESGTGTGTSDSTAFTSGEFALLRAKFPHDSARAIVSRVLWAIDALSDAKTGERVNDHVGYGIPVPLDALRDTVPATAPNPIYDEFARELGPGSGNTSSEPSSGTSSGPQSSGASAPSGSAPPTSTASGGGGGGGISPILIVVIVVVVVAIAAIVMALVARSRRKRPPFPPAGYGPPGGPPGGGYGPPPPGYGPPPPGYGPPGR